MKSIFIVKLKNVMENYYYKILQKVNYIAIDRGSKMARLQTIKERLFAILLGIWYFIL